MMMFDQPHMHRPLQKSRFHRLKQLPYWLFFVSFITSGLAYDDIEEMMYIDLVNPTGCVRRLTTDKNGFIGCQSDPSGNVGVLHFIKPKVQFRCLV